MINGGSAELIGAAFHNGIIEFDLMMPETRGFAGVVFRSEGDHGENFYLRSHQSGNPDANQYTPIFNRTAAWQIYYGPRYAHPTVYRHNEWMHVKLVVKGDKMDVYIDGEEPVLHVDELLRGDGTGGLRLTGFLSDYYFSNIEVHQTDDVELVGKAEPAQELPEGLISKFTVTTKAVEGTLVEGKAELDPMLLDGLMWTELEVEKNGAANLSRASSRTRSENTLFAKLTLTTSEAKSVLMKYGFSDRVTLFLNGKAIAYGDDRFTSRDYRFLGTVGLYDGVFLPLKAGANEVVFAVTESFGGWAVMAAIEDQMGLNIR